MAPQKHGKPKYTYAERVLGAFSEIQRAHKRHAVHVASIRAQVKKTAEERKDRLGPQWKAWTGRAIQNLEEQGIFTPALPKGSVTLTPDAKKAMTQARSRLYSSPAKQGYDTEDVWRDVVTSQFTGTSKGLKRSRLHSTVDEGDSEEEENTRPTNQTPRKRPRQSAPAKTLSSMTKVQLQDEARKLRQSLGATGTRGTPKSVQKQLTQRDNQIKKLKNELKVMKAAMASENQRLPATSPARRLLTPSSIATRDVPISSPLPPRAAGLGRASGSLLYHRSNQPTPDPTGSPGSPLTELEDDDVERDLPQMADDIFNEGAQNYDDDYMPPQVEDVEPMVGSNQQQQLEADIAEKTKAIEELQATCNTHVADAVQMREIIASHDAKITALQAELESSLALTQTSTQKVSELVNQLREITARTDEERVKSAEEHKLLVEQRTQAEKDLLEEQARTKLLQAEIEEQKKLSDEATQAYVKEIEALSEAVAKKEQHISELLYQIEAHVDRIGSMAKEIANAEAALKEQTSNASELEQRVETLRMEKSDVLDSVNILEDQIAGLSAERDELVISNANANALVLEKQELVAALTTEARRHNIEIVELQGEKSAVDKVVADLSEKMNRLTVEHELTLGQLGEAIQHVESLKAAVSEAENKFLSEKAAKEEALASVQTLEHDKGQLRLGLKECEVEVAGLRDNLNAAKSTSDDLRESLEKMTEEKEDFSGRLFEETARVECLQADIDGERATIDDLRRELSTARKAAEGTEKKLKEVQSLLSETQAHEAEIQTQVKSLEHDLTNAVRRAQTAEDKAQKYASAKKKQTKIYDEMKDAYSRLKNAQEEMDAKLAAVGTSTLQRTTSLDDVFSQSQ